MGINFLAVLVAVIAASIFGMIWYSPVLFRTHWMHLMGTTTEEMQNHPHAKFGMIGNLLATLIMGVVIAVLFSYANIDTPLKAISAALLIWVGIIMTFNFNEIMFGKKPKGLWLLNSFQQLFVLLIMSYIIAIWH
ncbi:MAG: hypothetical protein JWO40_368 [Candidatus Doudnabacteria bacterium]|nr:hypothetical protein [Candidatus Doudnabacteria bacterium]